MVTDIIDRSLNVGDVVVFHNALYRVHAIPTVNKIGPAMISIMLYTPSKTTRPVIKHSREVCLISKEDMVVWKLKG